MMLEDSEGFAAVLCELLNQAIPSHKTLVARTVEEAQTLASEFPFDLFIIDINLPDGTGFDFLCDIRTVQPDARALITTAAPLPEYRVRAESLGVLRFFEKPLDFNKFVTVVRQLVRREPLEGETSSFQGTLRELQLADVIQLKCYSGSTTRLLFEGADGELGEIHLHRGQIAHAEVGDQQGVAAFEQMLGWRGGRFLEAAPLEKGPRSIDQDWQMLLMETARRLDELSSPAHS